MILAGRDLSIGYSDRLVGSHLDVQLATGEVLALLGAELVPVRAYDSARGIAFARFLAAADPTAAAGLYTQAQADFDRLTTDFPMSARADNAAPALVGITHGEGKPLPAHRRHGAALGRIGRHKIGVGQQSPPLTADLDQVGAVGAIAVQEHHQLARRAACARLEPRCRSTCG